MSDWQASALCRGYDTNRFYPQRGQEYEPEIVALCRACPVQGPCLEAGLANNELGRWGGSSELDRRRMRRGGALRVRELACGGCGTPVPKGHRSAGATAWCAAPECRREMSRRSSARRRGVA